MGQLINDVKITPLKQFSDEKGMVMHILRSDSEQYDKFGEVYCSLIFPGQVKGWNFHSQMTQNYAVPVGKIKIVLFDSRTSSKTFRAIQEIIVGRDCYSLITIPPGIWYSFKNLVNESSLIVNCANLAHTDGESKKLPLENEIIPFSWSNA